MRKCHRGFVTHDLVPQFLQPVLALSPTLVTSFEDDDDDDDDDDDESNE